MIKPTRNTGVQNLMVPMVESCADLAPPKRIRAARTSGGLLTSSTQLAQHYIGPVANFIGVGDDVGWRFNALSALRGQYKAG